MKRSISLALICALSLGVTVAQESKSVKTGWNFGPLPAVGYSSDMGLQYGALCEIYNFGDGSTYPEYRHKFYVEASTYTKGSSIFDFVYDSKYLIPGLRTLFAVSYLPDKMMSFHGFNGYMTPYDSAQNSAFYAMDRDYFRSFLNFQGNISNSFRWSGGLMLSSYNFSPVELEKYATSPSLFKEYLSEGIISEEETQGTHLEFRAGLVHDTRDLESDPKRGFWTELLAAASPDFFEGRNASYGTISLTHRGYIPLYGNALTFAYKAQYQTTIFGEMPIYQMQNISTLYYKKTHSEGAGGYTSLRGVLRNRAVGEGYFIANAELRYRFGYFDFIGQHWYLALNPFFDMGQVTKQVRSDRIMASDNPLIYNGDAEALHCSAGAGVKIVMNQNFIVGVEYGKALDARDGDSLVSIGLNFLF